jgi:hypothetical protein
MLISDSCKLPLVETDTAKWQCIPGRLMLVYIYYKGLWVAFSRNFLGIITGLNPSPVFTLSALPRSLHGEGYGKGGGAETAPR